MNARVFLLGLGGGLVGLAAVVQACGGSSDTPAPASTDSGVDSPSNGPPPDAAADAAETCDASTILTGNVSDAAIADGASSTGLCMGCITDKCSTSITQCQQYCPCQGAVSTLLTCYAANSDHPENCVAGFFAADQTTRTIGLGLFGCLQSSCAAACQLGAADAGDGGDGG